MILARACFLLLGTRIRFSLKGVCVLASSALCLLPVKALRLSRHHSQIRSDQSVKRKPNSPWTRISHLRSIQDGDYFDRVSSRLGCRSLSPSPAPSVAASSRDAFTAKNCPGQKVAEKLALKARPMQMAGSVYATLRPSTQFYVYRYNCEAFSGERKCCACDTPLGS